MVPLLIGRKEVSRRRTSDGGLFGSTGSGRKLKQMGKRLANVSDKGAGIGTDELAKSSFCPLVYVQGESLRVVPIIPIVVEEAYGHAMFGDIVSSCMMLTLEPHRKKSQ